MGDEPSTEKISVRLGTDADVDACLDVLNAAYGRASFTHDWFTWKHRECPWGVSRMYIAQDSSGILGIVFGFPWPYRRRGADGEIHDIDGARFVDGATLPPARGRRVLGILVHDELEAWGAPPLQPGVLLATATPPAQKSHSRNGAATLDPIVSTYGVPRSLRPARLIRGGAALDAFAPDAPGATPGGLTGGLISTAWTPDLLRWRTDPRSGRTYDAASLAQADDANGIVFRVGTERRIRTLFPILTWGTPAEQRRLLGAVTIATRSALVQAPEGDAVAPPLTRPLRRSGASVMCVWDRRDTEGTDGTDDPGGAAPPATASASWCLSMADLEGLI